MIESLWTVAYCGFVVVLSGVCFWLLTDDDGRPRFNGMVEDREIEGTTPLNDLAA